MKLVGLISDTHGRLPDAALGALAYCNHIIHAGDICDPGILRELQIMAPTTAVLGNNDYDEYGKNVTRFAHPVIDGVRFLVAHYPNDARIGFNGSRAIAPGDPLPQVCVHGHTHIPEILAGRDAYPASLFICPGSCSRPRGIARRRSADGDGEVGAGAWHARLLSSRRDAGGLQPLSGSLRASCCQKSRECVCVSLPRSDECIVRIDLCHERKH